MQKTNDPMSNWQDTWGRLKAHPRERVKLLLGRLFYPHTTRRWLGFVRSHDVLWQQLDGFPKLLTRIYRPYGIRSLNCAQRVERITNHYRQMVQQGLCELLRRSANAPILVSQVKTKSGDPACLLLQAIRDGHREGEMSLQLHWNKRLLYSLTFILTGQGETCDLLVTRLQGSSEEDAKELIRAATKSFHGYRPAVLLVQAVRQFALDCGCDRVLLVNNWQRVALNPVRRMKIKTDLDSLWQDVGAQADAGGFYVLSPKVVFPQDFTDVASSKRAEARRKVALATELLQKLSAALIDLRSPVPA